MDKHPKVRTCLRPATRNPARLTAPTQNLTDHETLKRRFHNTATRCHDNDIRFTPVVFDGHVGGWDDSARTFVTWIPNVSSPPLASHPTTSISTWPSAFLRHCAVSKREPCGDAFAATLPELHEWQPAGDVDRDTDDARTAPCPAL